MRREIHKQLREELNIINFERVRGDEVMEEIQYPGNLTDADDDNLEAVVSTIVPILFSLIGIIGFIGNILVIVTVLFNQQMRNITNLLILNLSLADLLFVIFCIPATVSQALECLAMIFEENLNLFTQNIFIDIQF